VREAAERQGEDNGKARLGFLSELLDVGPRVSLDALGSTTAWLARVLMSVQEGFSAVVILKHAIEEKR
jgi:hypothetical protein